MTPYQEEGLKEYRLLELRLQSILEVIERRSDLGLDYQSLLHEYNMKTDQLERIVKMYGL